MANHCMKTFIFSYQRNINKNNIEIPFHHQSESKPKTNKQKNPITNGSTKDVGSKDEPFLILSLLVEALASVVTRERTTA